MRETKSQQKNEQQKIDNLPKSCLVAAKGKHGAASKRKEKLTAVDIIGRVKEALLDCSSNVLCVVFGRLSFCWPSAKSSILKCVI